MSFKLNLEANQDSHQISKILKIIIKGSKKGKIEFAQTLFKLFFLLHFNSKVVKYLH